MDTTPALPGACVRGRCAAGASVAEALDHICKVRLLTVDPLALKAGLLGSNPDGLFKL